ALLAQPRDLTVDAARRDDPIVDFQVVEKLLHLLLLALRRQQDDEVEDPQNQDERNNLDQGTRPVRRGHGEHGAHIKHQHGSCGWRDKLWWNFSLNSSNRPNSTLSLIRRRVSR